MQTSLKTLRPKLMGHFLLAFLPEPATWELSGISVKNTQIPRIVLHQHNCCSLREWDIWPSMWEGTARPGVLAGCTCFHQKGCVTVNHVYVFSSSFHIAKIKETIAQSIIMLLEYAKACAWDTYWHFLKYLFNILARSGIPMALQSSQINAPAVLIF